MKNIIAYKTILWKLMEENMLEKRFNRGNGYFDTYYIWNTEKGNFIGVIEGHTFWKM